MRSVTLLFAGALLLPGCKDDPSGPGGPIQDCSDDVPDIDVVIETTSNAVRFDWSPRCRVSLLGVEEEGGDRWWIGVEDENLIEPPVRYGRSPDAVPDEVALPLEDGETYTIVLWIATPGGDVLAAIEEFVR